MSKNHQHQEFSMLPEKEKVAKEVIIAKSNSSDDQNQNTTTNNRTENIVSTKNKSLTLAYEGLSTIPQVLCEHYGNIIEILDLSHNELSTLDFLSHFSNLVTLILDHNHLCKNSVFPKLPKLTTLWVNHNEISELHPFISNLNVSCPNLICLSLMGNQGAPSYLTGGTYYEYLQYRLYVISCLPNLAYLDDRQVSLDQRQEARRLYGRSFYLTHFLYADHYLERFRKGFQGLMQALSWKSDDDERRSRDEYFTDVSVQGEFQVQDMGNIQSDSSESSQNEPVAVVQPVVASATATDKKPKKCRGRNLVI